MKKKIEQLIKKITYKKLILGIIIISLASLIYVIMYDKFLYEYIEIQTEIIAMFIVALGTITGLLAVISHTVEQSLNKIKSIKNKNKEEAEQNKEEAKQTKEKAKQNKEEAEQNKEEAEHKLKYIIYNTISIILLLVCILIGFIGGRGDWDRFIAIIIGVPIFGISTLGGIIAYIVNSKGEVSNEQSRDNN